MSDMVSIEEVNKLVASANKGFTEIKKGMEVMDRNILVDMQVLFDKQMDTINILDTMSKSMEHMVTIMEKTAPIQKNTKGKSLLFWGGVALVGYGVYKSTESKKGNNRG